MKSLLIFPILACMAHGYEVLPRFSSEKGLYLGELRKDEAGLSAKVYALSSTLILLSDLSIDEDIKGVFIFAGTLNEDGSYTKVGYPLKLINGKIRPLHLIAKDLIVNNEESDQRSNSKMVVLKFPDKESILKVDWIAAISRKQRDVYSRILIDDKFLINIPRSKLLPGLLKGSEVLSPHLLYSDQRTIEILDFNFDPSDNETIFRAILSKGPKKDEELLICSEPIRGFTKNTITLKLPDGTQAFRLKALELYSLKTMQSITYSIYPPSLNLSILPPSLIQMGLLHDEKLKNEVYFTENCEASLASLEKVESTTVRITTQGTRKRILPQFEHFPSPTDTLQEKNSSNSEIPIKVFRNKNIRASLKNRRLSSIRKIPRNRTLIEPENTYPIPSSDNEEEQTYSEEDSTIRKNENDFNNDFDYKDQFTEEEFIPNQQFPKFSRQKLPLMRRTHTPPYRGDNIHLVEREYLKEGTTGDPSQLVPRYPPQAQLHRGFPDFRRPMRRRIPSAPENPGGLLLNKESPIGFRIRNRDIHQLTETSADSFPPVVPPSPSPGWRSRDVLTPRSDSPLPPPAPQPVPIFEGESRAKGPLHSLFSFISKPRHWFRGQRPKMPPGGSNGLEDSLINLKRNRDTMAYLNMQERSKNRQQIQRLGGLSFRKRFLTPFPHEQEVKRPGRPMVRLSTQRNEAPLFVQPESDLQYGREALEANISVIPHELLSKSIASPKYYESSSSERKFDPLKLNKESGFKPIVKGPGNQPILAFNVMEKRENVFNEPGSRNFTSVKDGYNMFIKEHSQITPIPKQETELNDYLNQQFTSNGKSNTFIYSYSQNTTPIPESTTSIETSSTPFPERRKAIGVRQLPRYRVEKFNSADFDSFTQLPQAETLSYRNDAYYQPYNERDRIDDPNQPLLYSN